MPKTPAAEVDAGGRAVRVSSPDRVIYEATERTPEVTKLMVAEYFASVDDGLMRALRDRPTALERWTSGVRPGMKLATSRMDKDADSRSHHSWPLSLRCCITCVVAMKRTRSRGPKRCWSVPCRMSITCS